MTPSRRLSLQSTVLTLAIGCVGAISGWLLSAPVYILIGPAVAVTLSGLAGARTGIDPQVRDLCFVILGMSVGTGFDADAWGAMVRWPLAFVFMAIMLWLILITCRVMLSRYFGFDDRSAILAAAPGHLSFVVAMASETGLDVARIAMTQSVRLLTLTLVVPFLALALGVDVAGTVVPQGAAMSAIHLVGLAVVSVVAGLIFKRLGVPAPLLMGALVASAAGHLSNVTPGVLPIWLILPAYLVLGALIGTRFSGVSLFDLGRGLSAGVAITFVAVVFAGLGAVPVAWALSMPLAHVLVAFSPGGLETMIAMGAVLGVVPGFVAACHIARLTLLTVLLPTMLARVQSD